jgi:hypothetical protein
MNPLSIVGTTTDARPVVSGLLDFCGTIGYPLEDAIRTADAMGFVPSWRHMLAEAERQGQRRFAVKLEACIVSVYGKEYWQTVKGGINGG